LLAALAGRRVSLSSPGFLAGPNAPDALRPLARTGTIVHLVPTVDPDDPATRYIVEDVASDGTTVWLAEFSRDELQLVARPG